MVKQSHTAVYRGFLYLLIKTSTILKNSLNSTEQNNIKSMTFLHYPEIGQNNKNLKLSKLFTRVYTIGL